jgi:hypothetical protein
VVEALPTSSDRVPPFDLKRIAASPVLASSALSTLTNMMPVTPMFSCRPMFSAAFALPAISFILTTTDLLRRGCGDLIRMPAADMPFISSWNCGAAVSKLPSMLPSNTKSLFGNATASLPSSACDFGGGASAGGVAGRAAPPGPPPKRRLLGA